MIKNGRYFVPPQKTDESFKQLFARLAATGVGRPVDRHGFADGAWTAETLADAISSIEANEHGIELRSVQIWFQDNHNGISDANIDWLARIFGCGDPDATSAWQAELRASKDRLTKERRELRKKEAAESTLDEAQGPLKLAIIQETKFPEAPHAETADQIMAEALPSKNAARSGFNISRKTEAFFGSESSLTLPLVVFTGACVLALIAFTLNIHSVLHFVDKGHARQVGFLWAPNWTVVFIALLPLFLAILIELLKCWLEEWRPKLLSYARPGLDIRAWDHGLTKASFSFWATFFVTVIIASAYNWTATHLVPLLQGDPGGWPIDWGRIAIVKPDQISIPAAIIFSALVFIYNGCTAYLFLAGHIFLNLMKSDFALIIKSIDVDAVRGSATSIERIGYHLMSGIFRCTAIGVIIILMMKLQSSFLQSGAVHILDWLRSDFLQVLGLKAVDEPQLNVQSVAPGFIYSFLCLLAIVGTFISAQLRIRIELRRVTRIKYIGLWTPWTPMNICMVLLVSSYFAIGFLPGFTIFILLSLLAATYVVSKPTERESAVVA